MWVYPAVNGFVVDRFTSNYIILTKMVKSSQIYIEVNLKTYRGLEMGKSSTKKNVTMGHNIMRPLIVVFLTCIMLWSFIFYYITGETLGCSLGFGLIAVIIAFISALWVFRRKIKTSNFALLAIAIHVFALPAVLISAVIVLILCIATGSCRADAIWGSLWKLSSIAGLVSFIGAVELGVKFFDIFDKERQKGAVAEAKFRTLKDIINPHYLFNIFSSIQAYIWFNKAKAERMLLLLAEALRYALKSEQKELVPLAEELDYVEKLAELNEMQGGEKSKVIKIVRNGDEDFLVPPFSIFIFEKFMLKFDTFSSIHKGEPNLMEGKRVGENYLIRYEFGDDDDWIDFASLIVETGKAFWPGTNIEYSIDKELREVKIWIPLKRSK